MTDTYNTKVPVTAWYAEQIRFDGKPQPSVFYGETQPSARNMDGTYRNIQNVRPLNFLGWDQLTLNELYERFNTLEPAVA